MSDLPLKDVILSVDKENTDKIGLYLGAGTRAVHTALTLHERLEAAGIPVELLPQEVNDFGRPDREDSEIYPGGVEVTGPENIALFKEKGGMTFDPDALRGYRFLAAPGAVNIHYSANSMLERILDTHNIPYETDEQYRIFISDTASMCAVALCGGEYSGKVRLLSENGYSTPDQASLRL